MTGKTNLSSNQLIPDATAAVLATGESILRNSNLYGLLTKYGVSCGTSQNKFPIIYFSSNCETLLQSAAEPFRRKVSVRLRRSAAGPSLGRSFRHARKVISAASQSCAR